MEIEMNGLSLQADINEPAGAAAGVVVFAHGSGSGRLSPRNRKVAQALVDRGLATVLLDLLTNDEESIDNITREYRFDIPRLAGRLVGATDWLESQLSLAALPVCFFGASTGAAAALIAAAKRPERTAAVVSRGGRPDLAGNVLPDVKAPTLLLVGGLDQVVIGLNQEAASAMLCEVNIEIIPGATHLFEEPGKLEAVSELAGDWFLEKCQQRGQKA